MKKYLLVPAFALIVIVSNLVMTTSANAFTLYNFRSRLCLEVPPNGGVGALAIQDTCKNGTLSQEWISSCFCIADGDGTLSVIFNFSGSGLGVAGAKQENGYSTEQNGTRLVAWSLTGGSDQTWGFKFVLYDPLPSFVGVRNNRCYQITNGASPSILLHDTTKKTFVMGVSGGRTDLWAPVVIWENLAHADQIWCVQD